MLKCHFKLILQILSFLFFNFNLVLDLISHAFNCSQFLVFLIQIIFELFQNFVEFIEVLLVLFAFLASLMLFSFFVFKIFFLNLIKFLLQALDMKFHLLLAFDVSSAFSF